MIENLSLEEFFKEFWVLGDTRDSDIFNRIYIILFIFGVVSIDRIFGYFIKYIFGKKGFKFNKCLDKQLLSFLCAVLIIIGSFKWVFDFIFDSVKYINWNIFSTFIRGNLKVIS